MVEERLTQKQLARRWVLKDIRLIDNLSNRSAYSYTPEDVKKIFRALQRELEIARSRFDGDDSGGSGQTVDRIRSLIPYASHKEGVNREPWLILF